MEKILRYLGTVVEEDKIKYLCTESLYPLYNEFVCKCIKGKSIVVGKEELFKLASDTRVYNLRVRRGGSICHYFDLTDLNDMYYRYPRVSGKMLNMLSSEGYVILNIGRVVDGRVECLLLGNPEMIRKYDNLFILKFCRSLGFSRLYFSDRVLKMRINKSDFINADLPERSEGMLIDMVYSKCPEVYDFIKHFDCGLGIELSKN